MKKQTQVEDQKLKINLEWPNGTIYIHALSYRNPICDVKRHSQGTTQCFTMIVCIVNIIRMVLIFTSHVPVNQSLSGNRMFLCMHGTL